jgi:hypothetical protein
MQSPQVNVDKYSLGGFAPEKGGIRAGQRGSRRTSTLTATPLRRYGLTIRMFGVRRAVMSDISGEAMWGYALCGGDAGVMERSQQFFDKTDRGRNGTAATRLEGVR